MVKVIRLNKHHRTFIVRLTEEEYQIIDNFVKQIAEKVKDELESAINEKIIELTPN